MKVKTIKLITGEELMARCEEKDNMIILHNPMTLNITSTQGSSVAMALIPWLMAGKTENIEVQKSSVVAIVEPKETAEKNYLSSITGLTL